MLRHLHNLEIEYTEAIILLILYASFEIKETHLSLIII